MKTAELNNTAPEIVWCAQLPALVLMVIKECWDAKTVYGTGWEEGVVREGASRPVLPESAVAACGYSRPPEWAGTHKKKTSLPLCGVERSFLYIGRTAPQASVNTLAMIFQPSRPFFRAWKSTQTVLTAEKVSCLQQSAGICARCTDSGAGFCECKQRLRAGHSAPRGCAFPRYAV